MKKYLFLIMMSVSFWGTAQNWTELTTNPDQAGLENNPLKGFVDLYNDENDFPTSMDAKLFGLDEVMFGLGNDPSDFDWTVMEEWVEENKEEGKYSYIQVNIDPAKGQSWMPEAIENLIPYYYYVHPSDPDLNDSCPDWNHPILMNGMLKFIEAFGAQYDNRPEIYMVHLGLYGVYGEWHIGDVGNPEHKPEYAMTEVNKKAIIEAYEAAFPNTKLLARYPENIPDPEIVGYSDGLIFTQSISNNSFFDHAFFHHTLNLYGADENWRNLPIGGEIDPDVQPVMWNEYPNQSFYVKDPILNPQDTIWIQDVDEVIDTTHFTFMFTHHIFLNDFIEGSVPWNNAIRAQKRMGYRFEVDSFQVTANNGFPAIEVNISNNGVAPFYANWDVEFAAINTLTGEVDTLGTADWNLNIIQPDNPSNYRSYISSESIADGTYKFLLRVINPLKTADNDAAPLRFANTSQDQDVDGWLTLGEVEISSGNLGTIPEELASLTISQSAANLTVGDNLSLGALVFPATANQDVTWASDHPSRAFVDQNGFVTAGQRYGDAKVFAYAQGGNLVAVCDITVEPIYTPVPSQIEAEDYIMISGPVSDGNKLGFIDVGDWMEYGIELSTPAIVETEMRYSRQPAGDAKIAILNEQGDTLDIVNLPSTTEWWIWDTSTSAPFTLAAGNHKLRLASITNGFDLDWIDFSINSTLVDTDGDGTPDFSDNCPTDPNKIEPGDCGCGVEDLDADLDGISDCIDPCLDNNSNDCSVYFSEIDICNQQVEIHNPTNATIDLTGYGIGRSPTYFGLVGMTPVSGSKVLAAGEYLVLDLSLINAPAGELELYSLSGFTSNPNYLVDYVQYNSANNPGSAMAVSVGVWDDVESFVSISTCPSDNSISTTLSDATGGKSTHSEDWCETSKTLASSNAACSVDPNACLASNYSTAPTGLTVDQSNGNSTQMQWDHYSSSADGCILNGGTIESLDPTAAFTQNPGNVLVQGPQIDGLPNGLDNSAALSPNASFNLFNAATFPAGGTGQMVPGAFYKWRVRCGCLIDISLPLPDRLQAANVVLSPWSEYNVFTNLGTSQQGLEQGYSNKSIAFDNNSFKAYPNPFEDRILIEDYDNQIKSYQILDASGRVLLSEIVDASGLIQIDAQTLSAGIYYLNISTSSEMITKKLLKHN